MQIRITIKKLIERTKDNEYTKYDEAEIYDQIVIDNGDKIEKLVAVANDLISVGEK